MDTIVKLILQWDSTRGLRLPAPRHIGNCHQIPTQPKVPFQIVKGMKVKAIMKQSWQLLLSLMGATWWGQGPGPTELLWDQQQLLCTILRAWQELQGWSASPSGWGGKAGGCWVSLPGKYSKQYLEMQLPTAFWLEWTRIGEGL